MFNQVIRRMQDMLLDNGNKEAVFDVSGCSQGVERAVGAKLSADYFCPQCHPTVKGSGNAEEQICMLIKTNI